MPMLRLAHKAENLSERGAYVLRSVRGNRDVTLLATGTEVAIAVEAATMLASEGIAAAVVSMPCWELFDRQPESYRRQVLGTAPRVAIEAALEFGWQKWLDREDVFIGMNGFGASDRAEKLYEHFGITAEHVVSAARRLAAARRA